MNVLIMATIITSKWQSLNVVISNSAIWNVVQSVMEIWNGCLQKRIAYKNLLSKIWEMDRNISDAFRGNRNGILGQNWLI